MFKNSWYHNVEGRHVFATDRTKESLGRCTISAALRENINDVTILIHSSPEIMLLTANRHKDLVDEPISAELAFTSSKGTLIVRTKTSDTNGGSTRQLQ